MASLLNLIHRPISNSIIGNLLKCKEHLHRGLLGLNNSSLQMQLLNVITRLVGRLVGRRGPFKSKQQTGSYKGALQLCLYLAYRNTYGSKINTCHSANIMGREARALILPLDCIYRRSNSQEPHDSTSPIFTLK